MGLQGPGSGRATLLQPACNTTQAAAPSAHPDPLRAARERHQRTYLPALVGGGPALTYQDPTRTVHFRGDQIRRVDVPDLGTFATVTLVMTVDTGSRRCRRST
jgi:hypothetical protein